MRSLGAAGVLALVLAVLVAATAIGLKAKAKTARVGHFGAVTSKCGQGQKPVSGGFEATEPDFPSSGILTYGAQKSGRGWRAAAHNFGDSGSLTAFAYCQPGTRVKARSKSIDVRADEVGTVKAKCKRGSKVVSGGFDNPDVAFNDSVVIYPTISRKAGGRKWQVSGYNSGTKRGTLTAFAYCRKGAGGLKTASDDAPVGAFPATATATARCERGRKAVSGGFATAFDPVGESGINFYVSRLNGNRAWSASGLNNFGDGAGILTSYVYCQRSG